MVEITNSNHLMQVLMGLNDIYDHIRNQVLLMDPLPSVNKAYFMVPRELKNRDKTLRRMELTEEDIRRRIELKRVRGIVISVRLIVM